MATLWGIEPLTVLLAGGWGASTGSDQFVLRICSLHTPGSKLPDKRQDRAGEGGPTSMLTGCLTSPLPSLSLSGPHP